MKHVSFLQKALLLGLFLIVLGVLLALKLPLDNTKTTVTVAQSRPNILFLIADDWSSPHAGVYGDGLVRTPTFDRLANTGALFTNAFCASPSCSPSRASILLGRYPHQMESVGNLWSVIPDKFPNWVSLLQQSGYHTGKTRKGWGPGDFKAGGYDYNPAGKEFSSFKAFLKERKPGEPFTFWFGSSDPHRIYQTNTGIKAGMDPDLVSVPAFLPDTPCIRNDMLDYYYEVERFDRECGNILVTLEKEGLLDNTIIVMTSDNGMPFPRAKANLYDYGTRMPLAVYWKGHIEGGERINDFISFVDIAPTLVEAAGVQIPQEFEGTSFLELFGTEKNRLNRDKVFFERERHANVRKGNLSYPSRAIRTKDFLYIRNYEPSRWPAGDPNVYQSVGQYGDVDNSITKFQIMQLQDSNNEEYFNLSFGKRPYEELYVLENDPFTIKNEIENLKYKGQLTGLRNELDTWMLKTNDLRAKNPKTVYWDTVLYIAKDQQKAFDLNNKIKAYKMLLSGQGSFKEIECGDMDGLY